MGHSASFHQLRWSVTSLKASQWDRILFSFGGTGSSFQFGGTGSSFHFGGTGSSFHLVPHPPTFDMPSSLWDFQCYSDSVVSFCFDMGFPSC